jgi:hypothetical protein
MSFATEQPEPFATEWEHHDGYSVWVAAFHAPDGGVFMHRSIGADPKWFENERVRNLMLEEAREHFRREMAKR